MWACMMMKCEYMRVLVLQMRLFTDEFVLGRL
jgi:hypothetical protein